MKSYSAVVVETKNGCPGEAALAKDVLERQIAKRSGQFVVYCLTEERTSPLRLTLAPDESLPLDSFRIADAGADEIRIEAQSMSGLMAGVGKFLRCSRFDLGWFTPGNWRGVSSPKYPVRGIYFATHGSNWFETAPECELAEYVEEMALWGFNAIKWWYCLADYDSPDSPKSLRMVERLRLISRCATKVGMQVTAGIGANEGFNSTPEKLRASWKVENGYFERPIAWFLSQICPAKPGGTELILKNREAMLDLFADVNFSEVTLWPYDQGGCTCAECAPWGAKGYLTLAPKVAEVWKRRFPESRVVVSTWEFDKFVHGEFEALAQAFNPPPAWVDGILAEDHKGRPPEFILRHGVPGGLPLIGFPEITMWGFEPWGGYGALVNPAGLQSMWNQVRDITQGGFPYSEGPFEDVNKAICARFYWDDQPAAETLREYASFEFSPDLAGEIAAALELLEKSLPRDFPSKTLPVKYEIRDTASAEAAWEAISGLDNRLRPAVRRSWRWRLIFLRALIDHELVRHGGLVSPECEDALNELTEIYRYKSEANYLMHPQRVVRHGKPLSSRLQRPESSSPSQ